MNSPSGLTLQRRIGLLVLAASVIGLGLFSWLGIQSLNESTQRILDERLTLARHMAGNLDETLAHVIEQMEGAGLDGSARSTGKFAPAAESRLETLAQSKIAARNIILTDASGKATRVQPDNPGIVGTDMSVYTEVRQALAEGKPTISSLVSGPLLEVPVVFATAPIRDDKGRIAGALISSIDIAQSKNNAFRPSITVEQTGYIEIVDGNGIVITRTSPGSPPERFESSDHPGRFAELISRREATVGTCHRCHGSADELERRRDVLAFAPLSKASWGIAIRQSEEEALAPTRQLERRLLLLGAVVLAIALSMASAMVQGVVKPIKMLTAAARRVASGDFNTAIPTNRRDEIGQLSAAFDTMTQQLGQSRGELVLRNEELAAINSVATTVSQSLDLREIVEHALQKVLNVTGTTAGCVLLKSPEGNRLEMVSCIGPSGIFRCNESDLSTPNCACHMVLRTGKTTIIHDASQCPALADVASVRKGLLSFVSVPLRSQDRNLGVMNVACTSEYCSVESNSRILDPIGYHVGLAIENSFLFEEAKQKERLRGELLSAVINAQEEERKRVARELHDEFGQTLASLRMSIDALKEAAPPQTQFRDKLDNAKSIIVHALGEMRRLTSNLRPSVLDDLGLVAAIRTCAESQLEPLGIGVKFESDGLHGRLPTEVESTLFRIIQEAIHNITKHAQAHNVKIQVQVSESTVIAIVEDDGRGFDMPAVLKSRGGGLSLGLLGIQERATLLGGTLHIESQPGRGTRLIVKIPVTELREQHRPGMKSRI